MAMGLPESGVTYVAETGISPHPGRAKAPMQPDLRRSPESIPGGVLQAESMTGEFNFLAGLDRRSDLLGVIDQPITIKVEITDCLGRATRTTYTANYLVVDHEKRALSHHYTCHRLERGKAGRPPQ